MSNPLILNPTFASTPYFFDRNQDRGSYSGSSNKEFEGQSWRGGADGDNGKGVSTLSPSLLLV